jgi:hypothetical protein
MRENTNGNKNKQWKNQKNIQRDAQACEANETRVS